MNNFSQRGFSVTSAVFICIILNIVHTDDEYGKISVDIAVLIWYN